MNLSFWERDTWFSNIDFAVIGSGIVGLSCALSLRKRFPNAKIVVFEKGMLPSGASTKNAGFACFGSVSEILDDLRTHSEEEVVELIRARVNGLNLLRNTLGDSQLEFQQQGGYELFTEYDRELYENCLEKVPYINSLLKNVFFDENEVFSIKNDPFSFNNIQKQLIFNRFEGQLNTGKMMHALIRKASEMGILVLNNANIVSYLDKNDQILIKMPENVEFSSKKLFIATNGFAKQLFSEDVIPARAQVLITHPIKNLHIKGTFHLDRGYYYFRNVGDRVLFGGGRNLDFSTEETMDFGTTGLVQNRLEELLSTTILPNTSFTIDTRWSGIMGVGQQKKPIVKQLSNNVYCGVRLGGMGIAIGSSIGKQLADLLPSS
ncbi:NAD(P)/FAD-dependent oxidoreductase [Constantimarinum furrinae]|uniref:FAD dependent oxidoreductase n=1 Tax=Constantimarinum furrinae TaxID=2562285 RepID=A0A7G8PT70_9FLAO|nr:FAD-dependent oxidoreductase [Constantimarinum furrinae]QNJ97536.1 FAD dependent oxidoreductase [Constantimarinum furrinae]